MSAVRWNSIVASAQFGAMPAKSVGLGLIFCPLGQIAPARLLNFGRITSILTGRQGHQPIGAAVFLWRPPVPGYRTGL